MATDRPRVQAYIEPELYKRYEDWKKEKGIDKDSPALNQMFAEYFGVSSSSSSAPGPQLPQEAIEKIVRDEVNALFKNKMEEDAEFWVNRLSERLATVEKSLERFVGCSHREINELKSDLGERLVACEDSLEVLLSDSPSNSLEPENDTRSPEQLPEEEAPGIEESNGSNAGLEGDAGEVIEEESLLSDESPSDLPKSVNGSELARRLGVAKSVISNRKARSDFEEWSKEHDPSGIAWRYDRKKQRFFPIGVHDGSLPLLPVNRSL